MKTSSNGRKIIHLRLGKCSLLRVALIPKNSDWKKKGFSQYCYEYYFIVNLVFLVYEIVPLDYIIHESALMISLGIMAFCFSILAVIIGLVLFFSKNLKIKREFFFTCANVFAFCISIVHIVTMMAIWVHLLSRG